MAIIEEIENLTEKDHQECLEMLPQLLPEAELPSFGVFQEIITAPGTHLFVARNENSKIIGMLTLILYRIPIGLCARFEDIVVHENHRRQGIGKQLCQAAIDAAKSAGAIKIDLTSNPARTEAHKLHESLGFKIYDTTVYRYNLH